MANEKEITLTYLNIRQSIAILVAKLVAIDLIFSVIIIVLYVALVQGGAVTEFAASNLFVFLSAFGLAGVVKILIAVYVVLQWLNEYYELTPEFIVHKHGVIFKKQEHYRLDHVRGMDVQDIFIGELFNFATITLYDIRLNKYMDMYLIHNARRYAKILKQLKPHMEMKEDHVWNPLIEDIEIAPIEKKD